MPINYLEGEELGQFRTISQEMFFELSSRFAEISMRINNILYVGRISVRWDYTSDFRIFNAAGREIFTFPRMSHCHAKTGLDIYIDPAFLEEAEFKVTEDLSPERGLSLGYGLDEELKQETPIDQVRFELCGMCTEVCELKNQQEQWAEAGDKLDSA